MGASIAVGSEDDADFAALESDYVEDLFEVFGYSVYHRFDEFGVADYYGLLVVPYF